MLLLETTNLSMEKDNDSMLSEWMKPKEQLIYTLVLIAAMLPSLLIFGWFRLPSITLFLEIGKFSGVSLAFLLPYLYPVALVLIVVPPIATAIFVTAKLLEGGRKRIPHALPTGLGLNIIVSFSILLSFSLIFLPQVAHASKKIDAFVAENGNLSFENYVTNLTSFLNKNVEAVYNKPHAPLQINRLIYESPYLDSYIMQICGVNEAYEIVYQGCGSCREAAILIEELLHLARYETRLAHFSKNVIDHGWAEVRHNGTWLIVDPWWLTSNGTLVEAINLRNLKPAFRNATGVEVQYYNGTVADASQGHGY